MHHYIHYGAAAPGLAAPVLAHHAVVDLALLGATGAAHAGLSPPQKDEPHEAGGHVGLRGQGRDNTPDCANPSAECKHFNTLRARLALAGWVVTATPDNPHGAFTVSRWGMARDLDSLAAVEAFAAQVGDAIMKRATAQADRPGPMLFDCCRCGPARMQVCLTCRRWARHERMVSARRQQFAKIGAR